MWWNERFSPTGSTLRSEPDCNVYNCPRSKSESAAFGSAIGTMEPLVSLPLMSIGNDSMMSSSGSLKFNQFNYSITPLGIKWRSRSFRRLFCCFHSGSSCGWWCSWSQWVSCAFRDFRQRKIRNQFKILHVVVFSGCPHQTRVLGFCFPCQLYGYPVFVVLPDHTNK